MIHPMKIDGPSGPRGPAGPRRGDKSSGNSSGGFARALEGEEEGQGATVRAVRPSSPVDAILALQEVGDERSNRRRARTRASDLLDRLDELRHGLLTGTLSRDGLNQLVALIRSERPAVSDPEMAQVLDEIDLRAQVELAKLDVAQEGRPDGAD